MEGPPDVAARPKQQKAEDDYDQNPRDRDAAHRPSPCVRMLSLPEIIPKTPQAEQNQDHRPVPHQRPPQRTPVHQIEKQEKEAKYDQEDCWSVTAGAATAILCHGVSPCSSLSTEPIARMFP